MTKKSKESTIGAIEEIKAEEMVQATAENTQNLVRANKLTIQIPEDGKGYKAIFHRTHKVVGEVLSVNTAWVADARMNKNAQREMFRIWLMDNSATYGIKYDPEDRRAESNQMPSRYESDEQATEWAAKLVLGDVREWSDKMKADMKLDGLTLMGYQIDGIDGLEDWNGRLVNSKYANGCWAYAKIGVTFTLDYMNKANAHTEGYVGMTVNVVSGQLKKPAGIGENGYNFTGFKTEALKDLQSAIEVDFPKTETTSKKSDKSEKTAE